MSLFKSRLSLSQHLTDADVVQRSGSGPADSMSLTVDEREHEHGHVTSVGAEGAAVADERADGSHTFPMGMHRNVFNVMHDNHYTRHGGGGDGATRDGFVMQVAYQDSIMVSLGADGTASIIKSGPAFLVQSERCREPSLHDFRQGLITQFGDVNALAKYGRFLQYLHVNDVCAHFQVWPVIGGENSLDDPMFDDNGDHAHDRVPGTTPTAANNAVKPFDCNVALAALVRLEGCTSVEAEPSSPWCGGAVGCPLPGEIEAMRRDGDLCVKIDVALMLEVAADVGVDVVASVLVPSSFRPDHLAVVAIAAASTRNEIQCGFNVIGKMVTDAVVFGSSLDPPPCPLRMRPSSTPTPVMAAQAHAPVTGTVITFCCIQGASRRHFSRLFAAAAKVSQLCPARPPPHLMLHTPSMVAGASPGDGTVYLPGGNVVTTERSLSCAAHGKFTSSALLAMAHRIAAFTEAGSAAESAFRSGGAPRSSTVLSTSGIVCGPPGHTSAVARTVRMGRAAVSYRVEFTTRKAAAYTVDAVDLRQSSPIPHPGPLGQCSVVAGSVLVMTPLAATSAGIAAASSCFGRSHTGTVSKFVAIVSATVLSKSAIGLILPTGDCQPSSNDNGYAGGDDPPMYAHVVRAARAAEGFFTPTTCSINGTRRLAHPLPHQNNPQHGHNARSGSNGLRLPFTAEGEASATATASIGYRTVDSTAAGPAIEVCGLDVLLGASANPATWQLAVSEFYKVCRLPLAAMHAARAIFRVGDGDGGCRDFAGSVDDTKMAVAETGSATGASADINTAPETRREVAATVEQRVKAGIAVLATVVNTLRLGGYQWSETGMPEAGTARLGVRRRRSATDARSQCYRLPRCTCTLLLRLDNAHVFDFGFGVASTLRGAGTTAVPRSNSPHVSPIAPKLSDLPIAAAARRGGCTAWNDQLAWISPRRSGPRVTLVIPVGDVSTNRVEHFISTLRTAAAATSTVEFGSVSSITDPCASGTIAMLAQTLLNTTHTVKVPLVVIAAAAVSLQSLQTLFTALNASGINIAVVLAVVTMPRANKVDGIGCGGGAGSGNNSVTPLTLSIVSGVFGATICGDDASGWISGEFATTVVQVVVKSQSFDAVPPSAPCRVSCYEPLTAVGFGTVLVRALFLTLVAIGNVPCARPRPKLMIHRGVQRMLTLEGQSALVRAREVLSIGATVTVGSAEHAKVVLAFETIPWVTVMIVKPSAGKLSVCAGLVPELPFVVVSRASLGDLAPVSAAIDALVEWARCAPVHPGAPSARAPARAHEHGTRKVEAAHTLPDIGGEQCPFDVVVRACTASPSKSVTLAIGCGVPRRSVVCRAVLCCDTSGLTFLVEDRATSVDEPRWKNHQ
jgi:hypothetical protein